MMLAVAPIERDWFGKILYAVGRGLNWAIYSIVSLISEGLLNIANTQMFSGGVEAFTKRIYVILGVYMLFKLAFSLLSSVINPDMLLDKERGMQKIVPRTIMMLILLIMVPTIFSEAINLQAKIIPIIPKVIIGKSIDSSNNSGANYGENMASMALGAFILKNDGCESTTEESLAGYTVSSMLDEGTKACDKDSKLFAYDFNWIIAGLIGIVLAVVLFFYSVDVAIRLIKLGLLQLLAPIPIISYIDPKSSKDGAFASWLKLSISTYIDIFIKLSMFYFIIFILSSYASGDTNLITTPSGIGPVANAYLKIMILVGAIFFLMQAPKFIYGILGVKNPNVGVGLSGALAGTAALLGGAGFMGAAAAATKSMSETSQATGQGKQGPSGWTSGSDLAAQLRTGDQKAHGGFINGYIRNATRTAQQNTAQRELASRFGITSQGIADQKQFMLAAQDKVEAMQLAYQKGETSFTYSIAERDANGKVIRRTVTENFGADALADISSAKTTAAKSKSNYDKANKIAEQYGLAPTMAETYQSSLRERVQYQANRLRHPVESHNNLNNQRQTVGQRVGGSNNWHPDR